MRVILPVGLGIFGAGFCCCGDVLGLASPEAPVVPVEPPAAAAPAPAPLAQGGAPTKLGQTRCGRFEAYGVPLPDDSKISACLDDGVAGSLVVQAAGAPTQACAHFSAWGLEQGWAIANDVKAFGSYTLTLRKQSEILKVSCTPGNNATSLSLSLEPAR